MSMPTAPHVSRRKPAKPAHSAVAVLVLVLVVLGLASQCGPQAETNDSAPSTAVPTTTLPVPLAEAPQPAGNETADADRIAPLELPEPAPEPAPDLDSADTGANDNGGSAYYKNCSAAKAAGVTPLYIGEPGYSSKLDRDGDGVACE